MTALGLVAVGATGLALAIAGGSEDAARDEESATPAGLAAALDFRALAGQRLIAGWDSAEPPDGLFKLIREGGAAGVILFEDNVTGDAATRRTINRLQRARPAGTDRLLVMVDQEGGQVERVIGPPEASAEEMGVRGTEYARAQGRATGRRLADLGFNVDLAPVLDVARPGGAIDREQRSFGRQPATVEQVGVEGFTAGLRESGVAATAKHFPGIGAVSTNTDFAAQKLRLTREELRELDEEPFAAFTRAGGELVMLGLATYPAFADRPAAFSRSLATGELRGRLGFEGVSITDGLGAAAAQQFGSDAEIALAAAGAGADLLLYSDWRDARDAGRLFLRRLRSGQLDSAAFEVSAARVLALRSTQPGR